MNNIQQTWFYCDQHLAPHATEWCTVGKRHFTPLSATNFSDAMTECRARGFVLYEDTKVSRTTKAKGPRRI